MLWIRYICMAAVLLQAVTIAHRKGTSGKQGRKKKTHVVRKGSSSDTTLADDADHHSEGARVSRRGWVEGVSADHSGVDGYSSGGEEVLYVRHEKGARRRLEARGEGGGDDYPAAEERAAGLESAPQTVHSPESDASSEDCSQCPYNLNLNNRRLNRIEQIKQRVLTATGLHTAPDVKGVVLSTIPAFQGLIQDMENNRPHHSPGHHHTYMFEEPSSKPNLIFSPIEPAPPELRIPANTSVLYFRLNYDQMSVSVKKAVLHVFLKKVESESERDEGIQVTVYKIVRPNNTEDYVKKEEVTSIWREYLANTGDWVTIPIYKLLKQWLSVPEDNLGLVVEAYNYDNEQVALTDATERPENAPMLEIHTEENQRVRKRRDSAEQYCSLNNTKRCCIHPLAVNFVELGWDFIVAPKIYQANFCNGECPLLYAHKYAHSALVLKMNKSAGPCCGARKYSSMKMLYYDHKHQIKLDTIKDMVVERCDCS